MKSVRAEKQKPQLREQPGKRGIMKYAIRVYMTPHKTDSPKKPYFWSILKSKDTYKWCGVDYGWAKTPEEAWKAAQSRYREIEGGTQNDDGRSA